MAEQIDVFDEKTGAGYQNQQIDDATGTAQTSSATKGYAPTDGTVLTKGSGANKETGVLRPVNTGNAATDFANTMYNNALSQHFMDPGLRDISLHENLLSGTGESKRGELDDFMTWDFGTTKFDTDPNTMTRAEVKADRADKAWNVPRAVATGLMASGASTAGTVASWVTGLAAGVARTAGYAGAADRMQNGVNSYFSDLEQSLRNTLPIYEKESEENAPAWTSLAWYTSPKRLQDFLAMFGFTIGAGLTFKAAALLGRGFQFGYAAFEGATAVDKYMGRNEGSEKDGWSWKNLLPLTFGLTAGIGQKFLPAPIRNKLGLLATAGASAAGEAEIEAFHAREDFIQNKSDALLQNCNARKAEVAQIYEAKMDQATSLDEIQAIREEWDTQNKIIDWQYTQGYNSIVKNSRAAGDITRLWNYPILMFSNAVMFGKSMLGGLKTFQTSGKVGYSDEFNQALKAAYAADKKASSLNLLSKARRGRRNEIKKDVEKQFISAEKPIFSTDKKLTARDYLRLAELPASEGSEEMTQGIASNAGKAYAEVASDNDYANLTNSIIAPGGKRRYFNVDLANGSLSEFDEDEWASRPPFGFERDEEGNLVFKGTQEDYYSQFHSPDERLAAYRHAESQFEAAMKSIPNTLSDPEMWYEFALGALMGAIGCPWARSARVVRSTGEKDANGNIVTDKHWRSPIFLQGGIWNEYKKMKTDRQRLGEMAEQINKTLTPESIRKMRANFDLMVYNSNYEQEKDKAAKAFFINKQGDKFRYKNASDAELLKQIEVFQNIGQLDLFKHIVQSDLDLTTADELRVLQAATTTTDEKGNKSGAYAEFDLTPVPENGSDAAKQKLEEQVNKMRDKIKRNTDEIVNAIDTYANARTELQAESENGLTDDQLNCQAWYRVRLGMFDRRTKEMFEQNKGQLDKLNEKMPAFINERREALLKDKVTLQNLLETEQDETKKKEYERLLSLTELTLEQCDDAEAEWAQRWQDAQSEKDPLKRARILFAGNKKGDPIGTHGVKAPWYKFWSQNPWERRVKESMSPAAKRRAALMGVNLDWMGIEGQTGVGALDWIISSLRGKDGEATSEVLSKAFSDQQEREKFADALDDMRECQAAVVRYKDFYQFYKDNPQAMTERKKEEEQKLQQAAAAQERKEIADALKSAKTVAELYDKIVELLKEGKSLKDVNEALGEMVKEGNEAAKQLMKNQEFVRAFSSALNAIVNGEDYRTGALKPLLMAVAIDCAREAKSVDELRKAIETKLAEVLATPESFYEYYKAQDFFGEKDEKKRMTLEGIKDAKMKRFQKDANGKYAQTGEEVSRLDLLRDLAPKMLSAIDNIIKEKQFLKEKYSFGESMSEEERALVSRDAAAATPVPTPTKATAAEMAGLVNPVIKEEKKEGEEKEGEKEGETTESEASKEETKAKEEAKKRQEEIDKNRPQEPIEEDVVMSDDSDDTAEEVGRQEIDRQTTEDAQNNQKRTWWMDALSFFNIQKKYGEKKLIRNCFIKIAGKVNEIVKNIADSSFKDIWETYSKLNIFNFIDETPNAVKKGEPVYFIIDKIDPATGKSQIFGLNENELSYNGMPRVFMAVKRGNGYQAIGTLNTNKERQKAKGQDLFHETLLKESAKSDKAYVHKDTAKVGGVHSGLVETQAEENTLDKVFGGSDKVKVAVKTRTKGVYSNLDKGETSLLDDSKMKPGRIYVLVKDNPTGKYVAMPCRVVHFGQKDQAAFGETKVWKEALAAIDNLVNAAMKVDESDPASIEAFNAAYTALGRIIALQGYGVHIDVRKDPNTGKNKIILSKPKFKDGQPVFLTDKEGNPVYRKDKDGNDILGMDGNPIQAHDRDMLSFVIESAEQAKGVLLKDLLGDSFSVPFRVPLGAITENRTALADIINSGVITTNIVDGGGLYTRGGSVWVDVSGMQIVQDASNNQGTQAHQTESTESGVTTAPRVSQTIGKEIRTEFSVKGEFKFAFVLSPDGTLSLESRRGDSQSAVEWAFPINDTSLVKMVKDTMMRNNGVIDKEGISGIPLVGRDCVFFVKDENGNIALIEANKGQFRISNEWRSFGKNKTEAYEAYVNFLKTYERLDIGTKYAAMIDPAAKTDPKRAAEILAGVTARETGEIKEQAIARLFLDRLITKKLEAISKLDNPIGPEAERMYKEIIKDLKDNGFDGIYEDDIDNLDSHDMMVLYDIEKALTGETTIHSALSGVLDSFYSVNDQNNTEESSEEDTTNQSQPSTQTQPSTQQESTKSEEQSSQQDQTSTQETKQEKKEEKKDDNEPIAKLESGESEDITSNRQSIDDLWSVRKTSDALEEKIDLSKEIEAMRQMDPSLSRGDAILIVEGLIKTGMNGIVAQGHFRDGLIVLSTMAVRGTGFHELFHKIFDAALDEKTKREMLDDVKKINPKIGTDSAAEEWLADAFKYYMLDQVYDNSWTARIKRFFRWLFRLSSYDYERISPVMRRVFTKARKGEYGKMLDSYDHKTLKESRIAEYKRLGFNEEAIDYLEQNHNSFYNQPIEVQQMLEERGWTAESFDILSVESRNEILAC